MGASVAQALSVGDVGGAAGTTALVLALAACLGLLCTCVCCAHCRRSKRADERLRARTRERVGARLASLEIVSASGEAATGDGEASEPTRAQAAPAGDEADAESVDASLRQGFRARVAMPEHE